MNKILCFGDSNTWGLDPVTKGRYSSKIRWTGKLQEKLRGKNAEIIEDGLCGRTTVYEDETRPGRKGLEAISNVKWDNDSITSVVLMLGTNDCKTYNKATPDEIADGIDKCLDVILEHVSAEQVLLISPIHLGEFVWKEEFDPEFNRKSVQVSKGLRKEYEKIAGKRGVNFIAAEDFAYPSKEDQEHLNEKGHSRLADVIFNELLNMNSICA